MISRVRGRVVGRDTDGVEIATAGGVVYEITVPLMVLQRIPPAPGDDFELRTLQVVRDDSVALYGFLEEGERELFSRLLTANRVGTKVAVSLMSAYTAHRLVRALVEKDVNALKQVTGVGKKTAERIILELADKVTDLAVAEPEAPGAGDGKMAHQAVSALVSLGYSFSSADETVRAVLEDGEVESSDELIRKALGRRGS